MRITFDLPDELMRRAKIAAVKRGVTLRHLVVEGLRQVLSRDEAARRRAKLPNIRIAKNAPLLRASITDLKAIEAEDEAQRLLVSDAGR